MQRLSQRTTEATLSEESAATNIYLVHNEWILPKRAALNISERATSTTKANRRLCGLIIILSYFFVTISHFPNRINAWQLPQHKGRSDRTFYSATQGRATSSSFKILAKKGWWREHGTTARPSSSRVVLKDIERNENHTVMVPTSAKVGQNLFLRVPHMLSKQLNNNSKSQQPEKTKKEPLPVLGHSHGMPWQTSIDPTYESPFAQNDKKSTSSPLSASPLFYMKFWEWQLQYMQDHLTNLREVPVESHTGNDLSYAVNKDAGVRIHTCQFTCDEYKTIRCTVVDGGCGLQVFTSLWYPSEQCNVPVLGIDLLQFNQDRHLCVVDFQPIQDTEEEHEVQYEHLLEPIRDLYPSLQGQMSKRFYDETQHFSRQMLFGRFQCSNNDKKKAENIDGSNRSEVPSVRDAAQWVQKDVFPAYCEYVQKHVGMVQDLMMKKQASSSLTDGTVRERHIQYDKYSAQRDPAQHLLAKHFGSSFSKDYVHDILFPLSKE